MQDWRDVADPGMFDWRAPVEAKIASFTPRSMPAPLWEKIADRVRETVSRAHPTSAGMAKELLAALSSVAAFCEQAGLGHGSAVWLDEATVTAFVRRGRPELSASSRASIASRVRSLAHPVPLADRDTFTTYRPGELGALWSAAGAQNTERRRSDARILIALGAGAGLTAMEIAQVRAHDVRPAGAAVVVAVRGAAQRMVIVRRAFEHTLAEAAHAHTGKVVYLLSPTRFSRDSVVAAALSAMRLPTECPRTSTRRLRATWLAELAESRIPLPVLAAAAGISDLSRLTRLLRHLHQPGTDDAADQLRNL